MRLFILILVAFSSCKTSPPCIVKDFTADSLRMTAYYDTIIYNYENQLLIKDSIIASMPTSVSVVTVIGNKKQTDSLRSALYLSNFKVERVRYYLNICLRNPTQEKFLKGWIKRAIE